MKRMQEWASEKADAANLDVHAWSETQSLSAEQLYYLNKVKCQDAKCEKPEDEARIRKNVEEG
eukprot:CAMPEP_0115642324 /NCGR_PEP_ID=MMETSP0272-20121206/36772_1 /TAXON_ID=71861 /ORGANISM="Scrippsiella trochoidea, Strain CCMP3099" /LENGTH=62 /DNA_ID=CAMNT_0003079649 /DNA_START=1 /DNA_END=185 /DNA_ORIENTATION=+